MSREGVLATVIVDQILADLTDRRGLKHEWRSIDEDIQEEIKTTWKDIILTALSREEQVTK